MSVVGPKYSQFATKPNSVFVDFVKHQISLVEGTTLVIKTSSDRQAIGSSEVFSRAFNIPVEY